MKWIHLIINTFQILLLFVCLFVSFFFFAPVEQIPLRWSMGMLSDSFLRVLQISLDHCKEEIVRFDSSFLHFTRLLMSNWTITNYSTHSCFTDLVDPQHYLVSYSKSQMPAGWKVREVECMIREVWLQCSSVCRLIRPSEMSRDMSHSCCLCAWLRFYRAHTLFM